MYRIGLREDLEVSKKDMCADNMGERTWMLSWSNRQSLMVMVSDWFGTRTAERDPPSNMRKMGDLTELAYSRTRIC